MDFSNRDVQSPASSSSNSRGSTTGNFNQQSGKKNKGASNKGEFKRILTVLGVLAVAILLGAIITLLVTSNNNVKAESKYVETNKLQAVFLNTGQVYFGHIKSLNDKYFVLTDIYYLQTTGNNSSSTSASNVTLVKLGCELHEPYDQMVINSDQVTFWENLQDGGQVAKAVSTFQKQNPQGQKCADQSSSASTSSGSNAQNANSSASSSSSNSSGQ